eukprot:Gb_37356 [translate_table: standard]
MSKEKKQGLVAYIVLGVPCKPNSGKMAPSQLALHYISASSEAISNADRMVASAPVIISALVLRRTVVAALTANLSFAARHPRIYWFASLDRSNRQMGTLNRMKMPSEKSIMALE